MALYVNSNAASLNAQRNLYKSGLELGKSMQRLSSGLRINSAKDDAAGLAIANKMTSQIRGIDQAIRNANDGISLAQTAEGALNETTSILQRMRELAVQSGNDTNSTTDRAAMDAEFQQLSAELTRISEQTKFNGTALLSGGFTAKQFQIGYDAGQTLSLTLSTAMGAGGLSVNNLTISTGGTNTSSVLGKLDAAITTVDQTRSKLGAFQNRLDSTISNLKNINENITASRARIMDADFAAETAAMTRAQILQQSGVSMLAQSNQLPQAALSLLG